MTDDESLKGFGFRMLKERPKGSKLPRPKGKRGITFKVLYTHQSTEYMGRNPITEHGEFATASEARLKIKEMLKTPPNGFYDEISSVQHVYGSPVVRGGYTVRATSDLGGLKLPDGRYPTKWKLR